VGQERRPEALLPPRPFAQRWVCGGRRGLFVCVQSGGDDRLRDRGLPEEAEEGDWVEERGWTDRVGGGNV
jgi:hypothetical protein